MSGYCFSCNDVLSSSALKMLVVKDLKFYASNSLKLCHLWILIAICVVFACLLFLVCLLVLVFISLQYHFAQCIFENRETNICYHNITQRDPKRSSICEINDGYMYRWWISQCLIELNVFLTEIPDKHGGFNQIISYLSELKVFEYLPNYPKRAFDIWSILGKTIVEVAITPLMFRTA